MTPTTADNEGSRGSTLAGGLGSLTALLCAGLYPSQAAAAAPGGGARLAGSQAQGPATDAVTALHHNPAMLASMPGLQLSTSLRGGVDLLTVRKSASHQLGAPQGRPYHRATLVNPVGGYFFGASYQLDPIAIGAGIYDLSSRFRPWSADSLRYHLAPDPDVGCTTDPRMPCPKLRNGGAHEIRTDYSVAAAWSLFDNLQVGVAVHFPRMRLHFSHDNDTRLMARDDAPSACWVDNASVEDPRCAERLSFSGRRQLRWLGRQDGLGTRFDFATTLGVSVGIGEHGRVGLRYRTRPLLSGGTVELRGRARVCTSGDAFDANPNGLESCHLAPTLEARLRTPLPREVAVGVSWNFGTARQWHVDTNSYWIDECPGGNRLAECDHRDARSLSLIGLDPSAAILPELQLYRGRQDVLGTEVFGEYDLWKTFHPKTRGDTTTAPRVSLLLGGGFRSPAVRAGAITAAESDGWTLAADVGPKIELLRSHGSWLLMPGYGLDILLPQRVGPGGAPPSFDPQAALDFAASGGDINSPSADTVLSGRARASNAGRYSGSAHVLMFTLRWSERE